MRQIPDHPLRYQLMNELHARPFPTVPTSATVVYLAVKQPHKAVYRDRSKDLEHLINLLDRYGAAHPQPDATHFTVQLGRHTLKWEQHTEFVSYTLHCEGLSERAFDPANFEVFPPEWLEELNGQRIASLQIRVLPRPEPDTCEITMKDRLKEWFVAESLIASHVLDNSMTVAGDFRIDAAGDMRFAMFVGPDTGPQRVGRVVQRICEIETYRAMSALGFARARTLGGRIAKQDVRLSQLMVEMTGDEHPDEAMLGQLLRVSAELEAMAAQSGFRFSATGAYEALVNQRIELLREKRFAGYQTLSEFMMRRYEPAMRTVKSTELQLTVLADRARRAGELLRTRVDVARSAQNQALLTSMDRRADQALRMQTTVEGLSVVAISYYAVSLASYALYPVSKSLGVSKEILTAGLVLPVIALVWSAVRQIRKGMHG